MDRLKTCFLKLKASPNTSDTALHKYIRCTGENPQKTLQGLQGQDQQSKLEPTHEDQTGLYLSEQNKNDYFTTRTQKEKLTNHIMTKSITNSSHFTLWGRPWSNFNRGQNHKEAVS